MYQNTPTLARVSKCGSAVSKKILKTDQNSKPAMTTWAILALSRHAAFFKRSRKDLISVLSMHGKKPAFSLYCILVSAYSSRPCCAVRCLYHWCAVSHCYCY